jgi:hypothetical protein
MVSAGFAYDLARLFGSNSGLTIFNVRGTYIPQQRSTLADAAIEAGCSHILWLDSDMRFPPDSLVRLLQHNEPIVAANYPMRRVPILPTAEHKEHGSLFSDESATGLVPVSQCGMGLMLVDVNVFKTIGEPYFVLGYNAVSKSFVGEDYYFCHKARKHGYKILIDQDLSRDVKHVGEIEFTMHHANLTREVHNQKREPLIVV